MTEKVTEEQVCRWLEEDPEIMTILGIIQSWHLPDCWLVAGTLRTFIWNRLSGQKGQPKDIDVVFFDPSLSYEESGVLAGKLMAKHPGINWEIKN